MTLRDLERVEAAVSALVYCHMGLQRLARSLAAGDEIECEDARACVTHWLEAAEWYMPRLTPPSPPAAALPWKAAA